MKRFECPCGFIAGDYIGLMQHQEQERKAVLDCIAYHQQRDELEFDNTLESV